jgi:methylated-DNA-[protein]-cysteine S-methyltransferase
MHTTTIASPLGPLHLAASAVGLTRCTLRTIRPAAHPDELGAPAWLDLARRELDAYFAGELREFGLPLDPRGTPLQKAVWRALLEIPYGETASYGEQAAKIDPSLFETEVEPWQRARVVGAANGRNPISIVVPCHRVIGADGSLTGYGGGLERKQALLDLERNRQLAIL